MKMLLRVASLVLLSTLPVSADTISYGELDAFRSLNMMVRFPDCEREECVRHTPSQNISPDRFMEADTVDFGGYRLLTLPTWIFDTEH